MKQYVVDAFTDKVFAGNPAAVCVMDKWLDDRTMQNIGNIRCGRNKPAPHFKRMTTWDIRQFAGFSFSAGFSKIYIENQRKRRLLSWHFLSTAR